MASPDRIERNRKEHRPSLSEEVFLVLEETAGLASEYNVLPDTRFLIKALLKNESALCYWDRLGINTEDIETLVEVEMDGIEPASQKPTSFMKFSLDIHKSIARAARETMRQGKRKIDVEHLIIGIMQPDQLVGEDRSSLMIPRVPSYNRFCVVTELPERDGNNYLQMLDLLGSDHIEPRRREVLTKAKIRYERRARDRRSVKISKGGPIHDLPL